MKSGEPAAPRGTTDEIAALIATLHETGQRLEELTAGEVDAVADRDGRAFMLRRAQEQLRHSEAAKQAAILNALPAQIALLDTQGRIVSVNDAWRLFAGAKAVQGPGYGIGLNYLETCARAQGDHAAQAHQVAEGIRSILGGAAKSFSLEYARDSSAEHRWFRLTVTRLAGERPHGAVVMHLDVTAARQTEEDLRASELRFRQMAENIRDVFFLEDAVSRRMLYISPAYEEIWGRTRESVYAKAESWNEAIHPDDRRSAHEKFEKGVAEGQFEHEYRIVRPDGSIRWMEERGFSVRDEAGETVRIAGVAKDVTERKQAAEEQERAAIRIERLNRVHAVLSQVNALIVRVRDRDELFKEACRIAVEAGAFRTAWIGVIDPHTLDGKVVAWRGAERGYIDRLRLTARDGTPDSERPASRAVRESRPVISNNIATDPAMEAQRDDLLGSGRKSVGCFPLYVGGNPEAVITLFAGEPDTFDEGERGLLLELAGNLSFALDHIEKSERLDYLAYYDALTGLGKRGLFLERVAQYMRGVAAGGQALALYLIDLERFKNVNDSLGPPAGDALLKQVAEWLTRNIGDANLLARVGADQFAVVLPKAGATQDVAAALEKTIAAFLEHPFRLSDAVFRIGAKAGVAMFPGDGATAEELFRNAEAALKKAKASGERYLFYTPKMHETTAGKLTLESQLRQALEKEEFVLHYQPKLDLAGGKLASAEALIRWNDPRTRLVLPGRFIAVLEETGLIHEVGRWVLRKAIEDSLHWRAAGLVALRVAVNVSALQLRHHGFITEVKQAIGVDAHAAAGLELEITESVIMQDVKHSIASLQAIRALGVSIAIDDFGTGFSSLSYLSRLPVDTLKIDRSFVIDMTASPEGLSLVSTIITLAHSLKLNVVAEGVETDEQARLLRLLGCDEVQGFLFGEAVPRDIFEARFLLPASGCASEQTKGATPCTLPGLT